MFAQVFFYFLLPLSEERKITSFFDMSGPLSSKNILVHQLLQNDFRTNLAGR